MSSLLEVHKLNKAFDGNKVLNDISFNVCPGDIVGFIGDNGAGKSTTFKAILDLIEFESGEIRIFGENNFLANPQNKEKIGVVFDSMNLPGHLTVNQLTKVFDNFFRNWDAQRFETLVNTFSLPKTKKIMQFSRGMSMKLSVAVALSHHAKLLLLDEATGGLDPSSREELLHELKEFVLHSEGGILLSSHIMSDIEKIATHLVFIKNGEILLADKKQKVIDEYAVVELRNGQQNTLPKEIIVATRTLQDNLEVLVTDKKRVPSNLLWNQISIEGISLLLSRGERI